METKDYFLEVVNKCDAMMFFGSYATAQKDVDKFSSLDEMIARRMK